MTAPVAALWTPNRPWEPDPWPGPQPGGFAPNRDEPAVRQSADWTCSAASLAWVMNACGIPAPGTGVITPKKWDEWDGVDLIRTVGGPGAVTPEYGLAWANGKDLEQAYTEYGFRVLRQEDIGWPDLAYWCALGVGQLGGARWYHWTGVRGYESFSFDLANPAPNWKGVGDDLDQYEWDNWGRWNAVFVTGRI